MNRAGCLHSTYTRDFGGPESVQLVSRHSSPLHVPWCSSPGVEGWVVGVFPPGGQLAGPVKAELKCFSFLNVCASGLHSTMVVIFGGVQFLEVDFQLSLE